MITLTGTTIKIPQGESGAVKFYFKNKQNDFPLILQKINPYVDEGYSSALRFIVRESPSNTSDIIIRKTYKLPDNTKVGDKSPLTEDPYFRRFESRTIKDGKDISAGDQDDILYYLSTNKMVSFFYLDPNYTADPTGKRPYDYDDSSLTVSFDRSDTENVMYKKYYYEISYIEGYKLGTDEEDIKICEHWLENGDFIISGALV